MWKLMTDDAISEHERKELADFILFTDKLTQGNTVKEFEEQWSKWLGCKYSIFVNSGSSANLMLVRAIHSMNKKDNPSWVSQACTWSTTISPILQNGGGLHLCDVDLTNFSPDLLQLETIFNKQKVEYLFLTHLLGFPSMSDDLLTLCEKYGVTLLEDCCEAHGASFKGKKVGNFGIGSSFSFFYGHHMTTIEGGMVCTNDEDLYHELLLLRSHGLLRELPSHERQNRQVEGVHPAFCFLRDGYNLRNTEINAKLGLMQLKGLDGNIEYRNRILSLFINSLDPRLFRTNFNTDGCSNFALPVFAKHPGLIDKVEKTLSHLGVEYRPCVAGNLHRHPLTDNVPNIYKDSNVEDIHKNCMYIGNHKDVKESQVSYLCRKLNELKVDHKL